MEPRRYAAFISYAHRDEAVARRLHRALERYRTPRRLAGRPNRDGTVPRRLIPVFRDREELPTSGDLGAAIRNALDAAAYLVVVCSPRAAASRWVNEEILGFKRLGRADRILAVIVEGEPGSSVAECFPPALHGDLGPDGPPRALPMEPIAADLRAGGDGWRRGLQKILAGLLGVDLDDLIRRERRRRHRRIAAAALAATIAVWAGGQLWQTVARREAGFQAEALAADAGQLLRGGELAKGAALLGRAVALVGPADDGPLPRLFAAAAGRLRSAPTALAELADRRLFTWNDRSWVRGARGIVQILDRPALLEGQGADGTVAVVVDGEGRVVSLDPVQGKVLDAAAPEKTAAPCGIVPADGGGLLVETEQVESGVPVIWQVDGKSGAITLAPDGPRTLDCAALAVPAQAVPRLGYPASRPAEPAALLGAPAIALPTSRRLDGTATAEAMVGRFAATALDGPPPAGFIAALPGAAAPLTALGELFAVAPLGLSRLDGMVDCPDRSLVLLTLGAGSEGGTLGLCRIEQGRARCDSLPYAGERAALWSDAACRMVAIGGDGGAARILDGAAGAPVALAGGPRSDVLALDPGGALLAVHGPDGITLFRRREGAAWVRDRLLPGVAATWLAFVGGRHLVALAADGKLTLFALASGNPLWPSARIGPPLAAAIETLARGRAGRGLALLGDPGGRAVVVVTAQGFESFDGATGIALGPVQSFPADAAWSDQAIAGARLGEVDGRLAVVIGGKVFKAEHPATPEEVAALLAHMEGLTGLSAVDGVTPLTTLPAH